MNRLDETVIFDVLDKTQIKQIVGLQIAEIGERLKGKDIVLEVTDEALAHIAEKSFDPHYGARPVKRFIQTQILNQVASLMLSKKFTKGSIAAVSLDKKGEIVVEAKKPKKIPSPITKKDLVTKK